MSVDVPRLRKVHNLTRKDLVKSIAPMVESKGYSVDEGMIASIESGAGLASEERAEAIFEAIKSTFPDYELKQETKIAKAKDYAFQRKAGILFTLALVLIGVATAFLWEKDGVAVGLFIAIVGLLITVTQVYFQMRDSSQ